MFLFAVVTQAFAVITRQDDQRIRKTRLLLQERHQTAYLSIDKGNSPVIGASLVTAGVRLRRVVGVMGIVKMNPEEERPPGALLQPAQRFVDYHVTRSFHNVCLRFVKMVEVEVIEIGFKTLIQSIAGIEHRGAEECPCSIAVLVQDLSERDCAGWKRIGGEVVHARGHGKASGKERSVCGKSQRNHGKGMSVAHGRTRQRIDVGRLNQPVAVAPQVVGTYRVNSNNDDIRFCFRCVELDRKRDEE